MIEPVPFRKDWAPDYLRARNTDNIDKAFRLQDREGMPGGPGGARVHGGWDIFAPPGTTVRSPRNGTVVRTYRTDDRYGPVYGGIVAIRFAGENRGVLFRHVDPLPNLAAGSAVKAGDPVARVTDWRDGGDHVHMEIHRDIGQGRTYFYANAVDPGEYSWRPYSPASLDQRLDDAWFGPNAGDAVKARIKAWKAAGSPDAPPRTSDSRMFRRLRTIGGFGKTSAQNIVKAFRPWRKN